MNQSASMGDADAVLEFLFGPLDASGSSDDAHTQRWFAKDPAFDRELATRFGAVHQAAAAGHLEPWLEELRGRLAYVIVLDQFSRNLFRDDARAFAGDARALAATLDGLERRDDLSLPLDQRAFLYMPLMHSEDLELQDRSVALFTALAAETPPVRAAVASERTRYAEAHRDIIRRFGRFPHRNAVLGRPSTDEEVEFLKQPGSAF